LILGNFGKAVVSNFGVLSPPLNDALDLVPDSPLLAVERLLGPVPDPVRLHQGRTCFPPGALPRAWTPEEFPITPETHAPPGGVAVLREAFAERLGRHRSAEVSAGQVFVSNGATHALSMVCHAILDRGDEVLLLSPQWLFADGVVRSVGALPVEVPVFLELCADPTHDFTSTIEAAITPRTRAIYFNSPNNPTGFRLSRGDLVRLGELAERHDLWLITDNAYENYDFTDEGFVDVGQIPEVADRTFALHTFSKTYAMPGARVGCLVVPPRLADHFAKWALYTIYSVATTSQFLAYQALAMPAKELARRRAKAYTAWSRTTEALVVPHTPVAGGLYTFLDLTDHPAGADGFLRQCAERGVTLTPGTVFGRHCGNRVRLCFTAAPPDRLAVGLEIVNDTYRTAEP
jgi:aspartate aminotransferase